MSGTALSKTFRLTFTALFIALVLFLGLTPFGLIPLGFINVTLLCVPVAVGCVLLGLKTGLCLGLCFGLVSLLSALGLSGVPASALAGALVARSPLLAALMCFVPRLLDALVLGNHRPGQPGGAGGHRRHRTDRRGRRGGGGRRAVGAHPVRPVENTRIAS